MAWMSFGDVAPMLVSVVFCLWLFTTILYQFDKCAVVISKFDVFHIIPRWTFFAPNPGQHDMHLGQRVGEIGAAAIAGGAELLGFFIETEGASGSDVALEAFGVKDELEALAAYCRGREIDRDRRRRERRGRTDRSRRGAHRPGRQAGDGVRR